MTPQLCGARACTPMMKSMRATYGRMDSGSSTRPRFDRHRQDLHSPTASNTALMAKFLINSGMTRSSGSRSLATFAANFARMVRVLFSSPIRWWTVWQISSNV